MVADPASEQQPDVVASRPDGDVALYLLWFSPVFPVGGFAYSQGLEWATETGVVCDAGTLADWCHVSLTRGAIYSDLIVLSLAARSRDAVAFEEARALAVALPPSRERMDETLQLGQAFLDAYGAGWPGNPATSTASGMTTGSASSTELAAKPVCPFPIAIAQIVRSHPAPLDPMLRAFAMASLQNIVSAAIRLSVIGAFDAHRILAGQLTTLDVVCSRALTATEDDLGTASFAADLASLHHETQTTRLFRS